MRTARLSDVQVAEIRLAERTVEAVRVARPRGRPRTRPGRLTCDRAYDSGPFRQDLRRRGIASGIPAKRRPAHYRPKRGRPTVYDVTGRQVAVLFAGAVAADQEVSASLDWSQLPSGVYVIRTTGTDVDLTQRVTVVR